MDPFAHTFTGAALAAGGLRKATPLATAALLIGSNAPDIDILLAWAGDYMSLAHRRGWTHGVLAWAVLPVLLTGLLLAWDSGVRRRRCPEAEPARAGPLLMLATLAVLTHPALDWLNNYGIRLLMPFDGRWFYGDALFIIDPWVWLLVGGASFLCWSRGVAGLAAWVLFWASASVLVSANGLVPSPAKAVWFSGLAVLALCRIAVPPPVYPTLARLGLSLVFVYSAASAAASAIAEGKVRAALVAEGRPAARVMVGPLPANPLAGNVVAETNGGYLLGQWHWLSTPRLSLNGEPLPKNLDHPAVTAAAEHPHAQRFLIWSRFPYAAIEAGKSGFTVSFGDARYAGFEGGIGGPVIHLGRDPAPEKKPEGM